MNLHIREFAKLTGVSVRTLHYYDEIGLLHPSAVDEQNGYRCYNESCLERMQEILFYRELDFPLKEIQLILSSPDYDKENALKEQKNLLILKKQRLERLISALDNAMKGENLSMNVFDNSEYEKKRQEYAKEAKEKWGNTTAYDEYTERSKNRTIDMENSINSAMNDILAKFADCNKCGLFPENSEVQSLVKKWQDFITKNYYTCTNEILAGLGEMYTVDERFKANIDRHGNGTAEFIRQAIKIYCN